MEDSQAKNEWDKIYEEYLKDEYPVFGGPFTNALTPWEWLKIYHHPPLSKNSTELYSEIENAIIKWTIDGTKTAGSLTRDLIDIIK